MSGRGGDWVVAYVERRHVLMDGGFTAYVTSRGAHEPVEWEVDGTERTDGRGGRTGVVSSGATRTVGQAKRKAIRAIAQIRAAEAAGGRG